MLQKAFEMYHQKTKYNKDPNLNVEVLPSYILYPYKQKIKKNITMAVHHNVKTNIHKQKYFGNKNIPIDQIIPSVKRPFLK